MKLLHTGKGNCINTDNIIGVFSANKGTGIRTEILVKIKGRDIFTVASKISARRLIKRVFKLKEDLPDGKEE